MKRLSGQIARFGLVGAVATLIHVFVFALLAQRLAGNAFLANLFAYLASWLMGFLGHTYFSFAVSTDEGPPRLLGTAARYLQASIATYMASALAVHVVVSMLGLPYQYCIPFLVTLVPGLAFVLNKYWVFRPTPSASLHGPDT